MIDLALDEENDLVIDGGDLATAIGVAVTQQLLRVRKSLVRGSWFADRRIGFPFDEMLGEKTELVKIQAWRRSMILSTPGVKAINRLDAAFDDATRTFATDGEVVYDNDATGPYRETEFIPKGGDL